MSTLKITFLIAIAGHLLCGVCDCLLTYLPHGRFRFEDMKDNKKLSAAFRDMPLRNPLLSMLLGCLAMFLFAFGYLALAGWMRAFSEPCAVLIRTFFQNCRRTFSGMCLSGCGNCWKKRKRTATRATMRTWRRF